MTTNWPRRCMRLGWVSALAGLTLLIPQTALAHSFGQVVSLPVPVWMYLYGAATALVLSFLMCALFIHRVEQTDTALPAASAPAALSDTGTSSWLWRSLQILSVAILGFCILTGLLGTQNAYANFNMTWFWVVFVLGFTYLSAMVGDLYAGLNPWKLITQWIAQLRPAAFEGRVRYPQRLAYWPALVLYMTFIWIELLAHSGPRGLGLLLLSYTALNLVGAWLFGRKAWFEYAEFFAVFLRLIAKMAIFEWTRDAQGRTRLRRRQHFNNLLHPHAHHLSLLLFVLFMLSSTAFDGLRETAPWVKLYWKDFYNSVTPWVGDNIVDSYAVLKPLYLAWQSVALLLSPFLYLLIYLLSVFALRRLAPTSLSTKELALRFAYTLLPIALVYHLTHYINLLLVQGTQIFRLASDPFGWGWNLFGTTRWFLQPLTLRPEWIWHTQVGLILLGHIISVYLAHLAALRIFPDRRSASLSQIPMLALMVAFTTFGLWILSLPISPAQGP